MYSADPTGVESMGVVVGVWLLLTILLRSKSQIRTGVTCKREWTAQLDKLSPNSSRKSFYICYMYSHSLCVHRECCLAWDRDGLHGLCGGSWGRKWPQRRQDMPLSQWTSLFAGCVRGAVLHAFAQTPDWTSPRLHRSQPVSECSW